MMKHTFVLAALLGAACAHAQSPANEPLYVTIAGGATKLNLDCAGTTSCDTSDTGVKLVGGYNFGNGFSLELGYASFGKFRAADGSLGISVKPTAVLLGGAYAVPLGSDWGLNVRLALAQVKTKISAVSGSLSGSDSESKAKALAGVGVTYAVSKAIKLELGADSTQIEFAGEKGTVRLFTAGATFAF